MSMSQPTPEPVPPAVRAQLLATEHWSLLATRSQTWNEVLARGHRVRPRDGADRHDGS